MNLVQISQNVRVTQSARHLRIVSPSIIGLKKRQRIPAAAKRTIATQISHYQITILLRVSHPHLLPCAPRFVLVSIIGQTATYFTVPRLIAPVAVGDMRMDSHSHVGSSVPQDGRSRLQAKARYSNTHAVILTVTGVSMPD